MELRQLRYFRAVVEAGSFSAAAQELYVSQPPLSLGVSKLESELGLELLVRTPRGVAPTVAGAYLLEAASRLLADADDIASTVLRFREGLEGSIAVAAVPVLMWHWMPELLRRHAGTHPGIEIKILSRTPWEAIDLLHRGKVDLAAIMVANYGTFSARHEDEFDSTDAGEVPLVAVLPPTYLDAPNPYLARDFGTSPLIMPPRTAIVPSLPEAVNKYLQAQGVVLASLRDVETIHAGLPLIESGLAWGILPDPDNRSINARFNVVTRHLEPAPEPLRIIILTRANDQDNAPVQALLRVIHQLPGGATT